MFSYRQRSADTDIENFVIADADMILLEIADTDAGTDMIFLEIADTHMIFFEVADTEADTDMNFLKIADTDTRRTVRGHACPPISGSRDLSIIVNLSFGPSLEPYLIFRPFFDPYLTTFLSQTLKRFSAVPRALLPRPCPL